MAIKMLKKTGPLYILPPKMSVYRRDFDKTKYMRNVCFLIKDEKLLEKI